MSQQFRYVLLHHFPYEPRLQTLVVVHHYVADADETRPRNLRVRSTKGFVQPARSLTDDGNIAAHRIHDKSVGRPVRPTGCSVLGDTTATIPDMHHVDERILGGHNR